MDWVLCAPRTKVGNRMQRAWKERLGWRCAYCHVALFLLFAMKAVAPAQEVAVQARATTSRAAREDAIRSIPFRRLSRAAQQRIVKVVKKPTMFRRMPISVIDCDPELHRFIVRHPETMVNVWQLMGITSLTAERTGQYQLNCSDGVGTTTSMELIYGDRDTHILFCNGAYDGPLFRKPLTGRCVLILKSGAVPNATQSLVTNRLDVFLQVDHAGLDIFAKTFHPLLGKSADMNFLESMRFLERLSRASEANGPGMQHMVGRLENLQPQIRSRFQQVVANVNSRAARQRATLPAVQPTPQPSVTQPRSASSKAVTLRGR